MNNIVNGNPRQMMAMDFANSKYVNGSPKPLTLEERLKSSILPRKSFEVYDLSGEMPIVCQPEVIDIANNYLNHYGIDLTKKDDTTQWDVFWAREMTAAKMAIAVGRIDYQQFLPGRHFMYDLLADSIAAIVNDEHNNYIKGKQIAEFGGGSGIGLVLLAQRGAYVTNVDNSRMALEFSRYLAQHHKVERMLNLVNRDFYETPFNPGTFDVVYNSGVVEHKEVNVEKLLSEMKRTTKPGGYVVLSIPNESSPFYRRLQQREDSVYKKFKDVINIMPWWKTRHALDLKKLIENAGLDFVKEDGILIPPSVEVKPGDIPREDIPIFEKYLSPTPYQTVEAIITNWRGFHGSVNPSFRKRYGWSIYAVGQKKA